MNQVTENIFRTPIENTVCNNRYLVSVTASPNAAGGGCSGIYVSFQLAGWLPGDELTEYFWTISNAGQDYVVNNCIDLDTLTFNCASRADFVWNDSINCCV